jgi:hypothetical protein
MGSEASEVGSMICCSGPKRSVLILPASRIMPSALSTELELAPVLAPTSAPEIGVGGTRSASSSGSGTGTASTKPQSRKRRRLSAKGIANVKANVGWG